MGGRKAIRKEYDRENKIPVIKCSICNGEQVAGFKDIHTGKFEEVMVIRDEKELREFLRTYSLSLNMVSKEY